jgi:hypothetical protein
VGLFLALVFGAGCLFSADNAIPQPESDVTFEALTQRAAIIFAGRVVKIEFPGEPQLEEKSETDSFVQITFQVDDGIRGAKSGDLITIQEWTGLWGGKAAAAQRYRVGEKVLIFYHRPNAAGITSPVGGTAGRFPIAGRDLIRLTPQRSQTLLRSKRLREIEPALEVASGASGTSTSLPYQKLARALRLIIEQEQQATQ